MKKLLIGVTLALSATLVATPAMAAEDCVPKDVTSEVVIDQAAVEAKDAVGEPTKTVPNPDYVPAVEEESHLVEHPAETKLVEHPAETQVVHHEAETHTEYHFAKFTQERTREKTNRGWGEWSAYGEWEKYMPETHTSWELGTAPLNTPQFHSSGTRDTSGGKVQWERLWQAQWDGQTREIEDKAAWDETVIVKPAWTETVIVKEAWTEKVIDVEGKDAVGEPTITVPNPDYVAAVEGKDAVTHTVVRAAVTCPAAAENTSKEGELAETGGDVAPLMYGLAAAAVLGIGGAVLLGKRRRHSHTE